MGKLDDTGEYLPFAKKHLVLGKDNGDTNISLKSIWPEPNWQELCDDGLSVEVCAYLSVYYSGWRNNPRPAQPSVSQEQWTNAYEKSLLVLQELFENVADNDDVKLLPERFRSRMGIPKKTGRQHIRDVYPLYAVGRGENRTYKTPFALTLRQSSLIHLLPKLGWPYTIKPYNVDLFPVAFEGGFYRLCSIQGKRFVYKETEEFPNKFKSETDAINALRCHMNLDVSPYIPRKKIETIRNIQLSYDVTPEQFINTFNFRGVQFGSSMPDKERQLFVNNSFYAFKVLAHILEIPDGWIGLGGQLGIAFGARGQGKASAHYESDLNIINLTRRSGPGAISHEWFHGVDALLARSRGYEGKLISEFITGVDMENAPDKFRKNILLMRNIITKQLCSGTKYFNQSQKLAGQKGARKYWIERSEMLARAFEAFVQDSLISKGISCDWLVMDTLLSDVPKEHHDKHPYPQGDERKNLNYSMFNLMKGIWSN
ncbi:TPA: LPD1 domain-containing protein [Vibrio diabolicus]